MEPIGNVVLELDASQGAFIHPLCIQHHKLSAVCLGHVELHEDKAIVFCSFTATGPSETWDKDRLTHASMGVPHLPLLMLGVMLGE